MFILNLLFTASFHPAKEGFPISGNVNSADPNNIEFFPHIPSLVPPNYVPTTGTLQLTFPRKEEIPGVLNPQVPQSEAGAGIFKPTRNQGKNPGGYFFSTDDFF